MSLALPGATAVAERGWLSAHKWLVLRRVSQLGLLALFLLGPVAGIWVVKGNLSSSLTLDVLPLTDPYLLAQSVAAGQRPLATALTGAALVLAFYLLVGGRVYCSWVCPVNLVTDTAAWLRLRFGIAGGRTPSKELRYWLLAGTFAGSFVTGTILWEWVNPVSMLHRGLVYGMGLAWGIVLAVFLFDLLIARHGWCGHVCPVGAFYGLVGRLSLARVSAAGRARCNDCMDCYAVCPEPQVIPPALRPVRPASPVIFSAACTNCGRCIDVCSKKVFRFTTRFDHRSDPA
ncbi:MAG: quinol dehydrogenase ferredoxin subunit NapH [Burkholderiales bacterium]|nr:quinol dehydrogenase ferredoxin subunit NapH [Burkholderiales bacterium]